jgi:AraC-like DNA-binding protein
MSIAVVLDGTFTYRSQHGRVFLAPGSLMLGNMGACFECGHDHGAGDRCAAFQFEPVLMEEIAATMTDVTRFTFPVHRIPPVDELMPLVARARRLAMTQDSMAAEELALQIAGTALNLANDTTYVTVAASDERRMASAVCLIEKRFAEPLSLATLARDAGLSRYRFLRVFSHVVGTTPYKFLLNRRLSAVADRLPDQPSRVADIALACGFNDLSEFTRRFRAKFGCTPSAFRAGVGAHQRMV